MAKQTVNSFSTSGRKTIDILNSVLYNKIDQQSREGRRIFEK